MSYKALSSITAGRDHFLGTSGGRGGTLFFLINLLLDKCEWEKVVPRKIADVWDYFEDINIIACLGWTGGKITLFDATDGSERISFSVKGALDLRLLKDRIRIIGRVIDEYDYEGNKIAGPFKLDAVKYIRNYTLTQSNKSYHLFNSEYKEISKFPINGNGITSFAHCTDTIAVAESGGPVTIFGSNGVMRRYLQSPAEHHPVHVGCSPDGRVFSIHAFTSMRSAIYMIHDTEGKLIAEHHLDKCPVLSQFLPDLPGWLDNDLEIIKVNPDRVERKHIAGGSDFFVGINKFHKQST